MSGDWVDDDTMSAEETMRHFAALDPQPTSGPTARYAVPQETWNRIQEHWGLLGIILAGYHIVLTPEQETQLREAVADRGPALGVPALPIVILEPGESEVFSDGWRARNKDGHIQVMSPGLTGALDL